MCLCVFMLLSCVVLVNVDSKFKVRNTEIHQHNKRQNMISICFIKITLMTGKYPNSKRATFYNDLPKEIKSR